MSAETAIESHVHRFDSAEFTLRFQDSSRGTVRYSGAVELACACGKRRLFGPSDGQPTKAFWGADFGTPNPWPESQPQHLAWLPADDERMAAARESK